MGRISEYSGSLAVFAFYDWTVDASGLILSGIGLRECTVELFEAVRVDRV